MNFTYFLLICLGLTGIINFSKILSPVRSIFKTLSNTLYSFITCPQCVGFWVGGFISLLFTPFFKLTFDFHFFPLIYFILMACISSFVNYAIYTFLDYIETITAIHLVQDDEEQ
jgi:hypothetical protein